MKHKKPECNKNLTQLERVIYVASNGPVTLNQIQKNIKKEFGIYDQETSISARLRQATTCGYQKHRTPVTNKKTGRVHYLYQLTKIRGSA